MNSIPPDTDSLVENRIESIEFSLRCFAYSLIGLVPILGLPWWLAAMSQGRKAKRAARGNWNPATRYLKLACWMIPLTLLTNAAFLMGTAVIATIVGQGGSICSTGHG